MKIVIILIIGIVRLTQSNFFDPDGYYYPVLKTNLSGVQIESFNIHTLDYFVNGKVDYDNPILTDPKIYLLLSNATELLKAKNILINRDTIYFEADLPNKKQLLFMGNFLDKRGQYWNLRDIKPQETVIASGLFILKQNKMALTTSKVDLTYWEGH